VLRERSQGAGKNDGRAFNWGYFWEDTALHKKRGGTDRAGYENGNLSNSRNQGKKTFCISYTSKERHSVLIGRQDPQKMRMWGEKDHIDTERKEATPSWEHREVKDSLSPAWGDRITHWRRVRAQRELRSGLNVDLDLLDTKSAMKQ